MLGDAVSSPSEPWSRGQRWCPSRCRSRSAKTRPQRTSFVVTSVPKELLDPLTKLIESQEAEEEIFRACPQHGLHSLKSLDNKCSFICESSGVVNGQTWLWADDEETLAVFDELAHVLLRHVPRHDEMMLYSASFTVIEHPVEDENSQWHVDWHGIPEGLCWTLLVPIWPIAPSAWKDLGGTQLCVSVERHADRQKQLPPALAHVLKEAATLSGADASVASNFEVLEHRYRPCECLLFEGNVLHRTGPYEVAQHRRVLASLMVGPKDQQYFHAVEQSLRKQGACFLRSKKNDAEDRQRPE
eukprot:symbB.v1.2.000967.t1/scaffold39.1/size394969/11